MRQEAVRGRQNMHLRDIRANKFIFIYLNTAGRRSGEHEAEGCEEREKIHLRGIRANMFIFLYLDTASR
jgi:hypothetical protein